MAGIDPFLVIVALIIAIIVVIVNIYVLVKYQHPDDRNEAYWPKALILLGLTLAAGTLLTIPLDVSNNENIFGCESFNSDECGGLSMNTFWKVLVAFLIIILSVLIPSAIFYYEANDKGLGLPSKSRPLCSAVFMEIVVVIVVIVVLVPMAVTINKSKIDVEEYTASLSDFTSLTATDVAKDVSTLENQDLTTPEIAAASAVSSSSSTYRLEVTFLIYAGALFAWIGYFFFALFAGVGFAAVPIDSILAYIHRPRHLTSSQYADNQILVQKRTADLLELAKLMQEERNRFKAESHGFFERRKRRGRDRVQVNKLKQMVYVLEKDFETLQMSYNNYGRYNPLVPMGTLLGGILGIILTTLWILQIILTVLVDPPATELLSDYLISFNLWVPAFGVMTVVLFCFYLLVCTVYGCFKFGLRCFCVSLHPMEVNGTYMNSFLFNLGVIVLCTLPAVHFAVRCLLAYCRYSSIGHYVYAEMDKLIFFSAFFRNDVFFYAIVVIFFISLGYFLLRPRDGPSSPAKMRSELLDHQRDVGTMREDLGRI